MLQLPQFIRSMLHVQHPLRMAVANTGWLLFDRLTRIVLGVTVGAWIARYLGPRDYGNLSYVLAFIAVFQAIVTLGMDSIIVRDLARSPADAPAILGSAFYMRLLAGIVCWIAAAASMIVMNGSQVEIWTMTVIAGASLPFLASDTVDLGFQSQSQSRRTVIAKMPAYIVANLLRVVLALAQAPLLAFAGAVALEYMLAAGGLALAQRRFPTATGWTFSRQVARRLLTESWPFLMAAVSVIVYMRIDQIMLKQFLGAEELGIYSAALPLSQIWNIIPTVLALSLAPYVAKQKQLGKESYSAALGVIFRIYAALGIAVSIFAAVTAPYVIHLLYGAAFERSTEVLRIHALSNIFVFLGVAQGLWAVNERVGSIMLYKTLLGAAVSVGGNLWAIPRYGIVGVASVYVFAQFVAAIASNLLFAPQVLAMQLRALTFVGWKK